jgi:hypothetical protein
MPVTPVPIPVPPVLPTSITVTTIVAYVAAFAVFIVGLLTFAGVVLPANVSPEIATWSAVAESVAGVVTALITTITHHATVKALAAYEQ